MMVADNLTGAGKQGYPFGATEFSFATRIAEFHLCNSSLPAEIAAHDVMSALLRHPAFRPALARLHPRPLSLSRHEIVDLSSHAEGRLALLIASAPEADIRFAAQLAAAAALHRSIVRLGLKAERQHAQAILGAESFHFATQEAPTLHSTLAALENSPKIWRAIAKTDNLSAASTLFEEFGRGVLHSFVAAVAPVLIDCLPSPHQPPLADALVSSLVKLMRRRNPRWAPIIA
ncbi:hypothetical protein [Rhizobium oryzicola]|uniref:Uncharacterized protein n=1 Tax=Rhizobium oryzicola TaxID=1232668 RepID=A0ABT8SXN1_9HYPH|nr:hypothetical protein [Rhizobium oryzicola]MDO1583182.1 hypothetical protein [Rhizobium oryzicola]